MTTTNLAKILGPALTEATDAILAFTQAFSGLIRAASLRVQAMDLHGITEVDIKRVNVQDGTVTLWNHRTIQLEQES